MWSYQPLLRVTPPAGLPTVYNLAAIDLMTVAQWIPEPIFSAKETLNRKRRNIPKGWRLRAAFNWVVDAGSASENALVEIALAVNRKGYLLELSMDNGVLYREVVLEEWPPRENLEGKNVGALYRVQFVCVALINDDSLPPETRQAPPGIAGWS